MFIKCAELPHSGPLALRDASAPALFCFQIVPRYNLRCQGQDGAMYPPGGQAGMPQTQKDPEKLSEMNSGKCG